MTSLKNFWHSLFSNTKNDVLSGITVALALVPEAVAFAFVAGIDPLVGLYGAFIMGIITAIFGGRPGMISGATGAMAVVMVNLIKTGNETGLAMTEPVQNLGLQWLFIALLAVGTVQILSGVLKLGKFVRLIPHPVMMGFVNGLAIVIFLSQLEMFETVAADGSKHWIGGMDMALMLGLVALTMGIMYALPKFTKKIPAALVAILTVALITIFAKMDVSTVGSFISEGGGQGMDGGLPQFQTGFLSFIGSLDGHWSLFFSTVFFLAAVGLIESLMTLNLIDELTETKGNTNKECIAQGGANILNGFFGGMGGCAMIGQSIINVNSGGKGRLSGIVAALALLSFILFGAKLIEQIPIAALVGVMFMVVIGTFAWSSFRIINQIPRADAFVLILVSSVTVFFNLAVAVLIGVIVSALVFAWEHAKQIQVREEKESKNLKKYYVWGPLFFGSVQGLNNHFDIKNDPKNVQIDFIESRVYDHSGIEAINNLVQKYLDQGITVKLFHLSPECKSLLLKKDPSFEKFIESDINDPRYYLITPSLGK